MARQIALITLLALLGCGREGDGEAWPESAPAPSRLPDLYASMTLEGSAGPVKLKAIMRSTDAERATGLMYRKERLKDDEGMLFNMMRDADHSFWMRNTYIPLDLVYIDKDGVIVGILKDVEPLSETSRRVGKPSRFVLELDGGFCDRHGVAAGSRVSMSVHSG